MDHGFIPNLHVILLGDSQRAGAYLPYGKHLVRQLLASRQPYGKRVGRPGSGILVEAWVSGDHRWVRITAEECGPFLMESGIVGLQNIGFLYTHLNDGLMHYNPQIRTYGADKKLLGKLNKLPGLASTVTSELQATPAMSAELDEEGNRDPSSEATLGMKKYCAGTIPPSIFTGKLRLYFQAQYGRKLASWDFSPNTANQPPSLDWTTRKDAGDYTFQFHSSRTGIFTDSAKRHWLVQLGVKGSSATTDQANVFKMVAHPCAERLRPLLLDPDVSDDDKGRVEAYILAASYPDPDFCVSKSVSIPLNYSLGYGWHFNWSGTAADIVQIEAISTGGSSYKHRSTHYRINIARHDEYVDDPTNTAFENEERRWTFTLEQVEQKEWKNGKWFEVIAFPDWGVNQLEIFGTQYGAQFGDAAPIYCFYVRDDLKIVRYSQSGGGATVYNKIISEPSLAYGALGWVTCSPPLSAPVVLGLAGCKYGGLTRIGTPVVTQFFVDDTAVTGGNETYSGVITEFSQKTRTNVDGYYGAAYGTTDADVGDAEVQLTTLGTGACQVSRWDYSSSGHGTVHVGPGDIALSSGITVTYTHKEYLYYYAQTTRLLCVIPFADSEAVYLYGNKHEVTTESGTTRQKMHSLGTLVKAVSLDGTEVATAYNYYGVEDAGAPLVLSTAAHEVGTDTNTQVGAYFVSGGGVQSFTPVEVIASFFAGGPITHVAQTFWTRTSAGLYRDTDGAGVALTGGYDALLDSKPYVFTGWA